MGFPPESAPLGAVADPDGVRFSVWSGTAERMWVCLFDADDKESRVELDRDGNGVFSTHVAGLRPGARYGIRADGPWEPDRAQLFDPAKLLTDPYATGLDRRYFWDPRLALGRDEAVDTAGLVPKSVVGEARPPVTQQPPVFEPGGLIYELHVRGFTMLHPDIPEDQRGTVAALAHPSVIDHLRKIGVSAVELMPVTAWIDERHLSPLGLTNAWGYNPVAFMALDPGLCPRGIGELRDTVAKLRKAGIGTILDVVFNHTGESDRFGPTLSLRGLDAAAYYRHDADGNHINDTGTGNTLACDHPMMRRLILDSLRHFVTQAGVDGFRFDLAPIIGRSATGFDPNAEIFREISADPVLSDRVMVAEPWDIGPGGYQLGNFPDNFLEWNDSYRDSVRRFWKGDPITPGEFVTGIAGSHDCFTGRETRTVNFIAAHDGFSLADLTAYQHKHNDANGEENRDGHGENHSWNNGVEGETRDAGVIAARKRDIMALLSTLFASRGTIMLTAGDEMGRTQQGNNNAYAQDNEITWINWDGLDPDLLDHTASLSRLRTENPALSDPRFLTGEADITGTPDVSWHRVDGGPKETPHWDDWQGQIVVMVLARGDGSRIAVAFNRSRDAVEVTLPDREGWVWDENPTELAARSVAFHVEKPGE